MDNVYKFVDSAAKEKPTYGFPDAMMEKLNAGKKLTREEKDALTEVFYGTFGQHNGAKLRYSGWEWNFTPFTKRFFVNIYGGWSEVMGFDKTSLRKAMPVVMEICEVK